jgi:hypothetical protein
MDTLPASAAPDLKFRVDRKVLARFFDNVYTPLL